MANKLQAMIAAGAALVSLAGSVVGAHALTAAPADAAGCADVLVLAARGTNEALGWWWTPGLGSVVGNPVYNAIDNAFAQTTNGYKVEYPAGTNQPASVQQGNRDVVAHLTERAAACPDQKYVLVGYSQGANVMDNAMGISSEGAKVGGPIVATIPAHVEPRIKAVLLFGNPIRGIGKSVTGPYATRTYDVCNTNDPVCDPNGSDWNVHLQYKKYADEAAAFVKARL
ncbi:cutinase family protein [Nocardia sp. NPDC050413]|uniref:cutinase family protein n=1 Tax=Nocardia sp. NPDC050413 TaxID=3155784 RepID=UPI0033CBCB79